ncbi:O-antigen ligase family protein [Stutzerimonas xanthomarina]|uniref:O-antigen ligase family protein n=1 Tax=Stutzerimonas xanthomarina TaxID=271420 RepID=UPI0029A0E021|nr:O-antigen ligase family protein [Stutzerimonas xanthomarina]MDX2354319.1 O-antigen ligase family protein [Stutzerimonas xanthomarina]
MFFSKHKETLIAALFLLFFSSTSLSYWSLDYSWLEQQRIAQLLLVVAASATLLLGYLRRPGAFAPPGNAVLLAFILGLASALLSQYPQWALKEWAKYVSSLALIIYLGYVLRQTAAQQLMLLILLVTSVLLAVQFIAFYLASFFTGTHDVNPYLMYPGFDNPRFYGQFQVLLIPMMHGLSFQQGWHNKLFNQNLIYLALLLQWCIVWALAGRGVLLGLCVACMVTLLTTGVRYKALLLQVATSALAGAAVYFLLFFCIPEWAGMARDIPSSLRFDLSKRDILWHGAWLMIQTQPIFGAGPLHYSAVWNHIGAHPHQATLQFFSEWGIPATLLFLFTITTGMLRGMSIIRNKTDSLDAALWMALLASLILAQVDGVFAMPYTEGWLASLAGLALARWAAPASTAAIAYSIRRGMFSILIFLAIAIIARILVVEVPLLRETSIKFYEEHNIGSPPRFWDQGWIPM